jgi:hypothetical protein
MENEGSYTIKSGISATQIAMPKLFQGNIDNLSQFREYVNEKLKSALTKERSELTNDEEFAIAYSAGVEIRTILNENGKWMQQTEPTGIIKDGGKWVVLTNTNGWILNDRD